MVPKVNQSGHNQTRPGITKSGDGGLRRDIWFAADQARKVDPQLGAKYHRLIVERRLHHYSAVCHLATTLLTRIAACWRNDERYVIRDVDGRRITPPKGEPSSKPATGSHPNSGPGHASPTKRADQRNKESTKSRSDADPLTTKPKQKGLDIG